jgi:pimeloyl-ACP methyl ester carboxylesterase
MRLDVAGHSTYAYTGTRTFDARKPSMVFVHGAANDHSVWALQSRYFAHHGFGVLAVDLPGHGRSAGAALRSVEAIAAWLVDLLDAAALERATIVGHSLGALATLEAASRSPDRIERIALLGPAVPMAVSDALLDASGSDPDLAYALIVGWSHSAARLLGGNPVPGMWMPGTALHLMNRAAPDVLHTDLRACADYQRGLDAASAVSSPALLIVGGADLMAPPKSAQALVQALRDKQVVTLPACGHAMMAEQPDAVLDALRAFMREQRDLPAGAQAKSA